MTIDKLLSLGFSFLIYKRAMIIKILVIRVLVWIKCDSEYKVISTVLGTFRGSLNIEKYRCRNTRVKANSMVMAN